MALESGDIASLHNTTKNVCVATLNLVHILICDSRKMHDRHIYADNIQITIGRGLDFIGGKGDIVHYATTISVSYSTFTAIEGVE